MANPFLPLIGATFVDQRGLLTPQAREFLRLLSVNQTTITEVIVQIPDLADEIAALQLALGQKQNKDGDLTKIAGLSGTGLAARIGNENWALRTLADSANIAWTNGNGVAGNPIPDLTPLVDAGGGTLLLTVFDAWGRKTGSSAATAADVPYDNTASGLAADDVQEAIDELAAGGGGGGGILPVVTGEISGDQPVFVYFDDGSLLYSEVA